MTIFLLVMMLGISFFDFRSYVIPDLLHVFLILGRILGSSSMKEIFFHGANGLYIALLLACLTGLLLSLFYLRKKERMIPFGPCICTGFLIVMLMDGKLF